MGIYKLDKSEETFCNGFKEYLIMKEWYNTIINLLAEEKANTGHWSVYKAEMQKIQKWLNDNKDLKA